MAAAKRPPAATTAAPAVVDARAASIANRTKLVNKRAVEMGMTTADRPLVTTLEERHQLFGAPISTGSILLDFLLGGGWPRGSSTKIWGPEGCGKSNLAMLAASIIVKNGGYVLWMQAEDGDPWRMANTYGIVTNDPHFLVYYCQGSGEQAIFGLKAFLMEGRIPANLLDLVVIDSLAGLEPKDLIDFDTKKNSAGKVKGPEGSVNPGRVAAMYASMFRYMHSTKALGTAAMIMISQARVDVGGYGTPEVSVGGRATDHAARLVVKMKKKSGEGMVKTNTAGEQVGHTNELTFTKDGYRHKLQGRKATFVVYYGKGVDNPSSYMDLLLATNGLVKVTSSKYETSPEILAMIGEGADAFKSFAGAPKVKAAFKEPVYLRAVKAYIEQYTEEGREASTEQDDTEPVVEDDDAAELGSETAEPELLEIESDE